MNQSIQLFQFEKSNVRALEIDKEPLFVGEDVAKILGYAEPRRAVSQHVDREDTKSLSRKDWGDSCPSLWSNPSDWTNKKVINESGVYSLIFDSKMPNAKKFKHWVTSEVLPQIRKTGSYVTDEKKKRLSIMEDNAATRRAKVLYKIAMATKSDSSKQNLLALAAKELTGEMTIPVMKHKEYSATEVGQRLGISSNKVGRIANKLGIKAEQPGQNKYGRWSNSKAQHSSKEVPQWLYFDEGLKAIEKSFNSEE